MIYLIAMFLILEIMVAVHFYLLGWTKAIDDLEEAGALSKKWYELKKSKKEKP